MKYYFESIDNVLKELDSSKEGLKSSQIDLKRTYYGINKLEEAQKDSLFKKIISSLSDPMIIMLLVTAGISAVTSAIQHESFSDVFIILFVVIINTIMGIVQESKAEKAIDSLKEMTKATSKVIRDGKKKTIKSEDIVVGDVLDLEAGDVVPADCRIIENYSMKAEESALTGESVPINKLIDILQSREGQKDIPLADRKNMLYSGSTIAYGRGRAVVTAIGMETEIGKIAKSLAQAEKDETPLQKKMRELSRTLTKLVIGICVLVFIVGIARKGGISGAIVIDTFLTAIALAVAAIPEGLPAVVTIILSIGVTSMSKRKALIRKLNAVETLGSIQVICSDKTGTLTQNKMTVEEFYSSDEKLLAKAMALCSDSIIEKGEEHAKGEPTENALVEYANKLGMPKYELTEKFPRIGEAPFDSNRKLMSTVHNEDGQIVQYTKGAIEMLLNICTSYLKDGEIIPLTEEIKQEIIKENKVYADKALRVLGAAYKKHNEKPKNFEPESIDIENNLTFIGFVGMIDPCREEVFEAIDRCRSAGIRPIMITGDQKDTAVAIAKRLKIIEREDQATLGESLENLTDEQMVEMVKKCSVYARVQPEHKTRIVKTLQDLGYIVAMTGDGVNDAPSIKKADVGVAMGITGTDVTKGVSDMVLADDNFATIVNAVEEGRKIYDNVRKVLQFQLSTNMAEVLTIFVSSMLGVTMLTPAHLLWINMVTDSTPGLALGTEKAEGNIMKRKPRPTNDSVFSDGAGVDMIFQGLMMAALVILSFFVGQHIQLGHFGIFESPDGMSMAFLTANFVEMFHAVCMRSQKNSIFKLKTMNWWLVGAFILTILLTLVVIYVPFFTNLFGFTAISIKELLIGFGLAFLIVPIIELQKFIKRRVNK